MKIVISNSSGIPIYEQIKDQIKSAIYKGDLKEGEMLPSIRQLARDLKISVITTTRAYTDLENEGFVSNMQGKGCYILPQNKELFKENALRDIEQKIEEAVKVAKLAKIKKSEFNSVINIIMREEDYE